MGRRALTFEGLQSDQCRDDFEAHSPDNQNIGNVDQFAGGGEHNGYVRPDRIQRVVPGIAR
jgi:hypothetical protein